MKYRILWAIGISMLILAGCNSEVSETVDLKHEKPEVGDAHVESDLPPADLILNNI